MSNLPVVITPAVTTGHDDHHELLHAFYNLGEGVRVFNVKHWTYGAAGDGVANDATAINAAYAAAVAAGGGIVWFPKGVYKYTADLTWNSNLVSVRGAGSTIVTLQASGTAKINARPAVFTVTQGPRYRGFTVKGDPAAPVNATGVYTGDVVADWQDVVVRDFAGAGSIGFHVHNLTNWTERNHFGLTLDNNKFGMVLSCANAGIFSFEYNYFAELRINVGAGQVGIESRNNVYVRGGHVHLIANVTDAGTLLSVQGTSAWDLGPNSIWAEQTGGTGGLGVVQASGAICLLSGDVNLATLASSNANPPGPNPTQVLGGPITTLPGSGRLYTKVIRQLYAPEAAPPTVAMLAAAGTAPPAAIISPTSNNARGAITVGTGTATAAGQFFQVAFSSPYEATPQVVISPTGFPSAMAPLQPYVFNQSAAGFWVGVIGIPAVSQAATTYGISYLVIG